jgi:hypothetical protein
MLEHLFLLVEFKPMFEFCLFSFFQKWKNFYFPSLLFPFPCAAQLAKSGRAPSAPSPSRHRSHSPQPVVSFRPSAAQLAPPPPATTDGRVPPVIPDLGSETGRGRDPDPESALRAPWPRPRTPRSTPGRYKACRRVARCFPLATPNPRILHSSQPQLRNPSIAIAVNPLVCRPSAIKEPSRGFAAR